MRRKPMNDKKSSLPPSLVESDLSTVELQHELRASDDFDDYIEKNADHLSSLSFLDHINELITKSGFKRSEILDKAGLNPSYGYQLISGIRNPSRDKVIQLAIGLSATVEQTNRLLVLGGFNPLYVRNKRDAALMHALDRKTEYHAVEEMLDRLSMQTLSKEI